MRVQAARTTAVRSVGTSRRASTDLRQRHRRGGHGSITDSQSHLVYSKFKVVEITKAKKDVNDNANTSSGILDTKVRDGSRLRSVKLKLRKFDQRRKLGS